MNPEFDEEIDLLELLVILKDRWKLIVCLTIAAAIAAGLISTYVLLPTYEAEATILFQQDSHDTNPVVISDTALAPYASLSALDPQLAISLNNRIEIFRSRTVINKAIVRLSELVDKTDEGEIRSLANIKENVENDRISNNVSIAQIQDTTGLRIKVQAQSPKIAKNMTDILVSEGVAFMESRKKQEFESSYNFVSDQLREVADRISSLEEEIMNSNGTTVSRLEQQRETNKELYALLSQKRLEMQLMRSKQLDEVEFIEEAMEPAAPIKPQKLLNIVVAAILAMFLGMFLVFIQHVFQQRVSQVAKDI